MKKPSLKELIIFENEQYLLLNKPSHVATLNDRNDPNNLLDWVRELVPDAQACHRLDKETSGCLAFAKNPEAYRNLAIQFEKRKVQKVYHAIADGLHEFRDERVLLPILQLNNGLVTINRQEGKQAETIFTTLEAYRAHTLIECRPVTGRMHQIRIHLKSLNAPISGDDAYGGKPLMLSEIKRNFNLKKDTEERPLISRVALHAYSLSFADVDGSIVAVEAPYFKDFSVAIKQLTKHR
jgi:23S rRNA pseudouridine955/2504/2580 synthase